MQYRHYILEHDQHEVHISVEDSKLAKNTIKDIHSYFVDSKVAKHSSEQEILVVEYIAEAALHAQIEQNLNPYGVMKAFDWNDQFSRGIEGFPAMDGSSGIYLTYCEDYEFDFSITEVKTSEEKPVLPKPYLPKPYEF